MKKILTTFADRALFIIVTLIVVLSVEIYILAVFLYKQEGLNTTNLLFILIPSLFVAITAVYIYHFIIKPYQKCRRKFRRFINGKIYKDLFIDDFQIFPEMMPALDIFDSLLDKQNVIRLSTKQAEFLALQNQINPHFLYNTLEAIRGDALCAGLENIADITEALSTFFRYTITETGNLVSLENELENVENYFKIQQYRFGEKLKMEIHLPENETYVLGLQFPKLTLQPIIENAVFHGLEGKAEGGTIKIHIETTENKVLVSIEDNGVGIAEDVLSEINRKLDLVSLNIINDDKKKRGSIALYNVCRRIKLLFGEEYGIHIFSMVGIGTDVRINIPIIKQ